MTGTTAFNLIITLSITLMTACTPTGNIAKAPPITNAMDTTMGSYSSRRADKLILVTMRDNVHNKLIQGESVSQEEKLPVPYATFLSDLARQYGIRRVADWPISSLSIRCLVFETNESKARNRIIASLNKDPNIETAQPLQLFQAMSVQAMSVQAMSVQSMGVQSMGVQPLAGPRSDSHYNDPYLKMQHGFKTMQVEPSHRWATGLGVKIAVIDTGLDIEHLDLSDRLLDSKNFVDRDNRQFKRDVHGTAITGIIAAVANNSTGMVGVAPDARILGLKACWQEMSGDGNADSDSAFCNSFTLTKAINYAIEQRVDIINLSLAGPRDPLLERLLEAALAKNILIVGAVHPKQPKNFPAAVEGVIAVAETGHRYRNADKAVKAPGEKVLSTYPGNEYDFYSGSSLSTAHITGLAALIRQRKPHLSARDVYDLITVTTVAKSDSANACRVFAVLVGATDCPEAEAATQ